MNKLYKCISIVSLIFVLFVPSSQALKYEIIDLGALNNTNSSANAINESGQIVGISNGHAFLWKNGTMTDLGTNGAVSSVANDINENGVITGWTTNASNHTTPFRYSGSTMTSLITGPGNFSNAFAINDSGIIAGRSYTGTGSLYGTTWNTSGTRTMLGTLGGSSYAYGINNKGQVVGHSYSGGYRHAYMWESGTMTDLGTYLGVESYSNDINESSQIAGWYKLANGNYQAYIWDGDFYDIDYLSGSTSNVATAINDDSQVVGYSGDYAFLWDSTNGTVDLNTFLASGSGWTLSSAADINNAGQIVGYGINPDGKTHAFLLNPIPEPLSLILLGAGIISLLRKKS